MAGVPSSTSSSTATRTPVKTTLPDFVSPIRFLLLFKRTTRLARGFKAYVNAHTVVAGRCPHHHSHSVRTLALESGYRSKISPRGPRKKQFQRLGCDGVMHW